MTNQTITKQEELTLVRKELFEEITIECYEDSEGNFRITRRQIGEALQYKDKHSFNNIFKRNKDVIGEPKVVKITTLDNKMRDVETYTFNQLFQILRFSKQPLANSFMSWASLTLEQLIMGKAELKFHKIEDETNYREKSQEILEDFMKEINIRFDELKADNEELKNKLYKMENNLVFKPYTRPTHRFESALTRYAIHFDYNGAKRYMQFYNDFEDWLNINLPKQKKFSTKEYLLETYNIDTIEMFIDGVISGRIVKNKNGHFVDLNGVFNNPVEWNKIKNSFNCECAYCGESDKPLVEEHIFPQTSEYTSDMIYNIIPACQDCNKSKNNTKMSEWYKSQPFYNENKFNKIKEHFMKYQHNVKFNK